MRSLNIRLDLYAFDELSEKVQFQLVKNRHEQIMNEDYNELMQPIFDQVEEKLNNLFDDASWFFSNHTQGSGFVFTGMFKESTVMVLLKDSSFDFIDKSAFTITRTHLGNMYTHEYTAQVGYCGEYESSSIRNALFNTAIEILSQYRIELCRTFNDMLNTAEERTLTKSLAVDQLRDLGEVFDIAGNIREDFSYLTFNQNT